MATLSSCAWLIPELVLLSFLEAIYILWALGKGTSCLFRHPGERVEEVQHIADGRCELRSWMVALSPQSQRCQANLGQPGKAMGWEVSGNFGGMKSHEKSPVLQSCIR